MVAEALMTVEDYRALERASLDARHEYIDGQVYLMAGGTADHSRVSIHVTALLDSALGDGPCRVYNSDMRVRLSATRYVYPDAAVTCEERDQGTVEEIVAPRLIVEVLSSSTEAYDRGRKFGRYRACPSIEEYVLVATEQQLVEVYRRTPEVWTLRAFGPGEDVALASVDVRCPIAAFYRRTTIPALPEDRR